MHTRLLRRFSHAPLLRALALLAWLAMAGVPVVASARTICMPNASDAASMHAHAPMSAGDCCQPHAGTGHAPAQCEACAASLTGLPVPVQFTLAPASFQPHAWPVSSSSPVVRPSVPPLRPPRC